MMILAANVRDRSQNKCSDDTEEVVDGGEVFIRSAVSETGAHSVVQSSPLVSPHSGTCSWYMVNDYKLIFLD